MKLGRRKRKGRVQLVLAVDAKLLLSRSSSQQQQQPLLQQQRQRRDLSLQVVQERKNLMQQLLLLRLRLRVLVYQLLKVLKLAGCQPEGDQR
jgi:shikimate kinase